MHQIIIRRGMATDSAELGQVHSRAWRETYEDLLPAAVFAESADADRGALWARVLADSSEREVGVVFIAQDGERICGFLSVGKQRDVELIAQGYVAEFTALYVLKAHQHHGIGRALMSAGARHLKMYGIDSAALWVLAENNKARDFYSALGAQMLATHAEEVHGFTILDVALGWKKIGSFL